MKSHKGWYKLLNPEKFIKPLDEYMGSYKDGQVLYKSSLEKKSFVYCDYNKYILKWSVESFAIPYIKPTDGKVHRYFIDLFLEFKTGDKFLVEIKPFSQTKYPKKPSKQTSRALMNYQRDVMTFAINEAKWKAATEFATSHGMKFTIITEKELK